MTNVTLTENASAIQVDAIRKKFGETVALDGADITLHDGEWLALLGPNGAGKTTLVRAIAGRVKPDAGSISILGNEVSISNDKIVRHHLGVVPQEIALFPLLNAKENLQAFAELHGVTGKDAHDRTAWALEWTGLKDHANRLTKTYSGGMKRRLNLACGILHHPKIILLDEPTEGVDPQSRERIWEMLQSLRDDGASLLHTTHHLHEAEEVCDRIVIIDHGKVAAAGTLAELVEQTVGASRLVRLTLDKPYVDGTIEGVEYSSDDKPNVVRCSIVNIGEDLPIALKRVESAGFVVQDMDVQHPTLHAVFLHLTGRELRES